MKLVFCFLFAFVFVYCIVVTCHDNVLFFCFNVYWYSVLYMISILLLVSVNLKSNYKDTYF